MVFQVPEIPHFSGEKKALSEGLSQLVSEEVDDTLLGVSSTRPVCGIRVVGVHSIHLDDSKQ